MRKAMMVVSGAVITVLGVVFSLQGFGALKGSSMSNTTSWSVAGPIIVVVGLGVMWWGARRRSA